jgi:hypothetical protein
MEKDFSYNSIILQYYLTKRNFKLAEELLDNREFK